MSFDDRDEMTPQRTDAIRQLLLQTVRSEPQRRSLRRRKRVVLWGGLGLVFGGLAATGGGLALNAAQVSNSTIVHCISSTTAESDGDYPQSSATIATGSGPGRVDDALALCRGMWEQGALDPNMDPLNPKPGPGAVPLELQVCVLRDGSAAVIPSGVSTMCQTMGMSPLAAS